MTHAHVFAGRAAAILALAAGLTVGAAGVGHAQTAAPEPAMAAAAPATMAAAFDEALRAYERSHWVAAYQALSRLADAGHPQAARMAMDMWRFGPRLYGIAFVASSAQVRHWAELWGCGGDATSLACQVALSGG